MRTSERNSEVMPPVDEYLQAKVEAEAAMTRRLREWHGLSFDDRHADEDLWWLSDPHLAALRGQADAPTYGLVESFAEQIDAAAKDFEARREQARFRVRVSEKLGEPVDDATRGLAEAESGQEQVAALVARRQQARRQAVYEVPR